MEKKAAIMNAKIARDLKTVKSRKPLNSKVSHPIPKTSAVARVAPILHEIETHERITIRDDSAISFNKQKLGLKDLLFDFIADPTLSSVIEGCDNRDRATFENLGNTVRNLNFLSSSVL
jgi:hypothetical protein